MPTAPSAKPGRSAPRLSFAALRHPGYRAFLATYVMVMMADNIEHVISYWMMFQKFHSPALGGFAVLSHWLPFLFFSVPVGALTDRADPRRIIQAGVLLFVTASLGWGAFFLTDSLQMWEAMLLLVLHGCSGVLWQTASQVLLHDVVPADELQSGVRLLATGRYLGVLVGPALGGAMLLGLGAAHGILLNTVYYLPALIWLGKAPYGSRVRAAGAATARRAVRGLADIALTMREVSSQPALVSMLLLAGAASFFVGSSYQAQMPNFAQDLGHGDPGTAYSMLLAADAAGALVAGFALESAGFLRARPRTALLLAMVWCVALGSFALSTSYPLALALLFAAGFFELAFSGMVQTLVQLDAPAASRGRIIGLFNMSSLGLRAFSGITVGVVGARTGVHRSLALSSACVLVVVALLFLRAPKSAAAPA